MNELESILNYLETTSLEPHDDYTSEFTYKEQKLLWNYIRQLKEQNKFLMKQDNILQTLMQWLYKIKDEPVNLYMGGRQIGRTFEQARFQVFCEVIDKIKELKEELEWQNI